jgi:hypothetical protein
MTIRLSARTASGSKAKLSRTTSVSTTLTGSDLGAILAVDSTPGTPIVITVPASPVIDDIYYLLDAKSNWGTTPITLSTALYYGNTETFILDQNATLITLIWRGGSIGWTVGVDTASQDNTQLSNLFSATAPKANPIFTGLVDADGATSVLVPTPVVGSNDKKAVNTEYLNQVLATQDGLPVSRTVTSSFTFVVGDKYKYILADTSSGNSFTGTLPTTGMVVGEWYGIVDISRTWDSVPVTIATALIQGQTQDASLDSAGDVIKIQWLGAPVGWMFMDGGVSLDPATLNRLFAGKADLYSPVFTGNPTVPTPGAGDDSNLISSTAFVARAIRENTSPPISRTVSTTTATVTSTDKNKTIAVDTAANAVMLTLPTTGQTVGDQYHFLDVKANWDTTPATLASAVFFGTTQTFTLNMAGTRVTATWQGLPIGWTVGNSNVSYDAAAINQMLTQVTNDIALPISRTVGTSTTVVGTDRNKTIAVDTSAGSAIVLTLPTAGLIDGDQYGFLDAKNTWGATTPSFASATFFGTTQTIELDQGGGLVVATWRGTTLGWTLSTGAAMYDSTTLQTLFQTKADIAYVDTTVANYVKPTSPWNLLPKILPFLHALPSWLTSSGGNSRTQRGFPTKPWAASRLEPKGSLVSNAGNIYYAVTGGTTAASGGPATTTGALITDGGVVWAYVNPDPHAWKASKAYAKVGQYVTNLGNFYCLVTAGTSAASGGPNANNTAVSDNTAVWARITPRWIDSVNGSDTNAGTSATVPLRTIPAAPTSNFLYFIAGGSSLFVDSTTTSAGITVNGQRVALTVYDRATANEIINQPNPLARALQLSWVTDSELSQMYFKIWSNGPTLNDTTVPGTNGKGVTGTGGGFHVKIRGAYVYGFPYGGMVAQSGTGYWDVEDCVIEDSRQIQTVGSSEYAGSGVRFEGASANGAHNFRRIFIKGSGEDSVWASAATQAVDWSFEESAIHHRPSLVTNNSHVDCFQFGSWPGAASIKRCVIEHDLSQVNYSDNTRTIGAAIIADGTGTAGTTAFEISDNIVLSTTLCTNMQTASSATGFARNIFATFPIAGELGAIHNGNTAWSLTDCVNVFGGRSSTADTMYLGVAPTLTRVTELEI